MGHIIRKFVYFLWQNSPSFFKSYIRSTKKANKISLRLPEIPNCSLQDFSIYKIKISFLTKYQLHGFIRKFVYLLWQNSPSFFKSYIRSTKIANKISLFVLNSPEQNLLKRSRVKVEYQINKTIDVVITTYNQSMYIENALKSILSQTYAISTITIVNHCELESEREALELIRKKIDSDLIKLVHISECWPGTARNFGAKFGNGDIILFLDGDDEISSEYAINAIFYLNLWNLDVVGAWCRNFSANDRDELNNQMWKTLPFPTWQNLVSSNAFPVSSFIRRKAFDAIGGWRDYDEKQKRQDEAIDLWRRAYLKGFKGANIQQAFVFLRRHSNNLSSTQNEKKFFKNKNIKSTWDGLLKREKLNESDLESKSNMEVLNVSAFDLINTSDISKNGTYIFLLPDGTFFGAGRVIRWFYNHLIGTNNLILFNLDSQGLGNDISKFLGEKEPHFIEFGSNFRLEDLSFYLEELISKTNCSKIISFGHPEANIHLSKIRLANPEIRIYNCMFNTESANALWLSKNPNSFDKIFIESYLSYTFLEDCGWQISHLGKINHLAHRVSVFAPKIDFIESNSSSARVVWFGRFASEKQPEMYIRLAVKMAKNDKFLFEIAGHGPLMSEIEKAIQRARKLGANLRLQDAKNGLEDLSNYDIYISTSTKVEGRPLTIIESLESGMCVFAPDVGSIKEYINDGYLGLFLYSSLDDLMNQLSTFGTREYIQNREQRSRKNSKLSEVRADTSIEL